MRRRICLFMADFAGGGAERVMVNIANELSRRGRHVDVLVARTSGDHRGLLSADIAVQELSGRLARTLLPLSQYLRNTRPAAILSAGVHACAIAALAKAWSGVPARLVLTLHGAIHADRGAPSGGLMERVDPLLLRTFYPYADRIVAVSEGLRREAMRHIGGSPAKYATIHNPVYSSEILDHAGERVEHPWLHPKAAPVIVAVGRLSREKGFDVLLRALALLRNRIACRLIVLGEGPERGPLAALAGALNIREQVEFHGFVRNPYAYMSRSRVLVMPSRQEAFGNVLVEAMAVGTPVVSTDCPHGPREILAGGRYGALVPPEDPESLATAVMHTMNAPPRSSALVERALCFSIERAVDLYEIVMGLAPRLPAPLPL